MDPKKAGGAVSDLIVKPLETIAGLALLIAIISGLGIWAKWWTEKQALAFVAPIIEAIAHFALMLLGPFADFAVVVGVIYALHSVKRGLEIAAAAAIVAFISWHFGGQDWIGGAFAALGHPNAGR